MISNSKSLTQDRLLRSQFSALGRRKGYLQTKKLVSKAVLYSSLQVVWSHSPRRGSTCWQKASLKKGQTSKTHPIRKQSYFPLTILRKPTWAEWLHSWPGISAHLVRLIEDDWQYECPYFPVLNSIGWLHHLTFAACPSSLESEPDVFEWVRNFDTETKSLG